MQGYNCIAVFSADCKSWLMCRRRKDPYKGLLNLVGGKIEKDEEHLAAAYRELREETGIEETDITLTNVINFSYPLDGCYVELYAGRLRTDREVRGEENDLIWTDLKRNFFDMGEFAGEGNIGYMLEIIKLHDEEILGKKIG
ncbi:MAG: NUDIX domain-containing protein [Ruminococcus sp.]|nr:NUDIX domain-containing protein [Ruminococcus sp.]